MVFGVLPAHRISEPTVEPNMTGPLSTGLSRQLVMDRKSCDTRMGCFAHRITCIDASNLKICTDAVDVGK